MKVYLLEHAYDYGEKFEHTEVKTLGIYESREKAEKQFQNTNYFLALMNMITNVFILVNTN